MAKSASTFKKRRTQKQNQNGMEFSESEMDVAEQLIQLSEDSSDDQDVESEMDAAVQLIQLSGDSSGEQEDTNNNSVEEEKEEEEGKAAEQGNKCDTVDVSSTNGELVFLNDKSVAEEEEEEDQILWQRKRRFRCIYDLYNSTNPITLVKASQE
ncbi:nucleolin-like [Quercus lobata]|uniref:nucleolin-like n=1 Tax=Quercus lobata TaxID=97700 RepID=UPI0012450A70|nr:nucleolin-like [Quercus lobata]